MPSTSGVTNVYLKYDKNLLHYVYARQIVAFSSSTSCTADCLHYPYSSISIIKDKIVTKDMDFTTGIDLDWWDTQVK